MFLNEYTYFCTVNTVKLISKTNVPDYSRQLVKTEKTPFDKTAFKMLNPNLRK